MKQFMRRKKVRGFIALLSAAASFMMVSIPTLAASLGAMSVAQSTMLPATTASYTLNFTTTTGSTLKEIDFQFATTSGGSTKPTNLDLTGATLGTLVGLSGSWSLDTTGATAGLLKITYSTGVSIAASTAIQVPLNNIVNGHIGDCTSSSTAYSDTCYIGITTYSDLGITSVDNGNVPFNFTQDPSMTFTIGGVSSGTSTNGVSTTATTTYNTIPFGHIIINDVNYAAQQLTVTTNAPNGYSVYMKVSTQLTGIYTGTLVSPFSGNSATWASPQSWRVPTGTTNGTDTMWFGANTSDTRVSGWSSASAKFGPANSTNNVVMYSSSADTGTSAYVTYAIEGNIYQDPDTYSGNIEYTIVPNY